MLPRPSLSPSVDNLWIKHLQSFLSVYNVDNFLVANENHSQLHLAYEDMGGGGG